MSDCKHCHGPHDVERHKARKVLHEAGQKCSMCEQASRQEHLIWAKRRALAYLPADPDEAIASMVSDLSKHQDWQDPVARALCADAYRHGRDAGMARAWIEGWN